MKALITGAGGQVGRELQKNRPPDWEITALNRTKLDITDSAAIRNALQIYRPDLVINGAAYTSVDKAEDEAEKAYAVNAEGAANIAKHAQSQGIRVIHISTDFVFDGRKSQPYLPSDNPGPTSVYGASKLQGEQAVLAETDGRAIILRTGWVYSSHGNNFVMTMLRLMAEKNKISVIADQIGTPTWAGDLARVIYKLADMSNLHGICHWTNAGVASWYDFAAAIQEEALQIGILRNAIPIIPIRTVDYPTPAKRPPYSVLDKTETWNKLGYTGFHWRQALRIMLAELNTG